jgi:elongin-A
MVVKAGQRRKFCPSYVAVTNSSDQPTTISQAPKGIFGKAKAEAQRAKVALTHASGKFDPIAANRLAGPTKPRQSNAPSSVTLFSGTQATASPVQSGPRIPAPRSTAGIKRPREASPISPLPGARPMAQNRTSLPSDIRATTESPKPAQDRFKVGQNRFESIKKPRVENFEPPRAPAASLRFGLQSQSTTKPAVRKPVNPAEEAARLNSVLFVKKKPNRPR